MNRTFLGGVFASFALASFVAAQTPTALIKEGDTLVGIGAVDTFENVLVNDRGTWIAHVRSTFPDVTREEVLLRSGFVTLREGSGLFAPSGALLGAFHSLAVNDAGHLALNVDLQGVPAANNSGLFWNTLVLLQKGTPIGLPGLDTRIWTGFGTVRMNGANTMLALAKTREAAGTGAGDDALVRLSVGATGELLSREVLLRKGDAVAAAGGDTLASFAPAEHALALNERGEHLELVKLTLTGWAWLRNADTVLAQDAFPSPLPGVVWRTLQNVPRCALNDFGDIVYTGALDTADNRDVIVKNGAIFVRKGDVLPALAPAAVGDTSPTPLVLTNGGDLFWFTKTDAESDAALLRNREVVLRRGITRVGGELVSAISAVDGAFAVSPDGRFLIARVTLGEQDALVWADFGLVVPVPGCAGNAGRLTLASGQARAGQHLEFALDAGQAPGVRPFLAFSSRAARPSSSCGLPTPFGELLLSPADRLAVFPLAPWTGSPVTLDVPIPNTAALIDAEFLAQGYFLDAGSATERVRLSDGLRIQLGAP